MCNHEGLRLDFRTDKKFQACLTYAFNPSNIGIISRRTLRVWRLNWQNQQLQAPGETLSQGNIAQGIQHPSLTSNKGTWACTLAHTSLHTYISHIYTQNNDIKKWMVTETCQILPHVTILTAKVPEPKFCHVIHQFWPSTVDLFWPWGQYMFAFAHKEKLPWFLQAGKVEDRWEEKHCPTWLSKKQWPSPTPPPLRPCSLN